MSFLRDFDWVKSEGLVLIKKGCGYVSFFLSESIGDPNDKKGSEKIKIKNALGKDQKATTISQKVSPLKIEECDRKSWSFIDFLWGVLKSYLYHWKLSPRQKSIIEIKESLDFSEIDDLENSQFRSSKSFELINLLKTSPRS